MKFRLRTKPHIVCGVRTNESGKKEMYDYGNDEKMVSGVAPYGEALLWSLHSFSKHSFSNLEALNPLRCFDTVYLAKLYLFIRERYEV